MNCIGIRSEEKHWDSRVTVSPEDIPGLSSKIHLKFEDDGKRELPFKRRVFTNEEILQAGTRGGAKTEIVTDLRDCPVIIGTKEIKECEVALSDKECIFIQNNSKAVLAIPQLLFDEKLSVLRLSDYLKKPEKGALQRAVADTPLTESVNRLLKTQETLIKANTAYVFFSHTHKGQSYNMRMLHEIMRKGCTLIDYELLRENRDGKSKRTVAYSRWAGVIGIIETLWTYGEHAYQRLGLETPFRKLHSPACYSQISCEYTSVHSLKKVVGEIGREIRQNGLPAALRIALTGVRGAVGGGALEALTEWGLPVSVITPEELTQPASAGLDLQKIHIVKMDYESLYRGRAGKNIAPSDIRSMIKAGQAKQLESNLDRFFPGIDIFLNCIVWTPNAPRLLANAYLRRLYQARKEETGRLLPVIGDITCDPNGSVQCCRDTYPNRPAYIWAPEHRDEPISSEHDLKKEAVDSPHFDLSRYGYSVMAVTNLPCEIPRDSSIAFSKEFCKKRDSLDGKSYLGCLAEANFEAEITESNLPEPMQEAVVLYRGKFNGNNPRILFKEIGIAMLTTGMLEARDVLPLA